MVSWGQKVFDSCREKELCLNRIELTAKERLIFNCLDLYPKTVDEIVRTAHIPVSEAVELLTRLCIKGAARECGRSNYIRPAG